MRKLSREVEQRKGNMLRTEIPFSEIRWRQKLRSEHTWTLFRLEIPFLWV